MLLEAAISLHRPENPTICSSTPARRAFAHRSTACTSLVPARIVPVDGPMSVNLSAMGKAVAIGALGGMAGALAMSLFQRVVTPLRGGGDANPAHSPPEAATAAVTGDDQTDPAVAAAQAIAEGARHRRLPPFAARLAGSGLHYAVGAFAGASYVLAGAVFPPVRFGFGSLLGAGVWVVGDEGLAAALGFTRPRAEYSAMDHAQALAAHLVFGVATHASIRALAR